SYLCILTLQDWLSINETLRHPDAQSERINIPANPRHYWRWRMHRYLDDFLAESGETKSFNLHVRQLVTAYGRC
ncbi:MAG: 4-alpha-glucanotransferase, partial [Prevotellaceae bacterium]|nr:4-alpha-glucanotransferase [Prevotellaceae bacterium]